MNTNLLAEVEAGTKKLAGKIADAIRSLTNQREEFTKQIAALNAKHQQLVGKPYTSSPASTGSGQSQSRAATKPTASPAPKKSKKRIRRSPEELKKLAGSVVALIKSKKDGVSAGEIIKNFGVLIPGTKQFVKKWSGISIKTTGVGAKTKYVA